MYKEMYPNDDLENLCEELVYQQIHEVLTSGEYGLPNTPVSIQDVAAIALNNMPAKYICNFMEKKYPSAQLKDKPDDLKEYANRQVIKAVKKVVANPHD
jgi:competence protein ComFB